MYSENSTSPTLHGIGCGGNTEPKIAIIDDMYANREPRVYKEYSPTLRSERQGLKVIESGHCVGKNAERKRRKQ